MESLLYGRLVRFPGDRCFHSLRSCSRYCCYWYHLRHTPYSFDPTHRHFLLSYQVDETCLNVSRSKVVSLVYQVCTIYMYYLYIDAKRNCGVVVCTTVYLSQQNPRNIENNILTMTTSHIHSGFDVRSLIFGGNHGHPRLKFQRTFQNTRMIPPVRRSFRICGVRCVTNFESYSINTQSSILYSVYIYIHVYTS